MPTTYPSTVAVAPGPLTALDASGNPNYPSASQGDRYRITVAGKIGGASGKVVEAGDVVEAIATNAGGTEASVGTSWIVLQANIASMTPAGLAMIQAANAAAQQVLLGITGGGAISLGGFTLTVPATGTAALLGTANVFTAAQTFPTGTNSATSINFGTAGTGMYGTSNQINFAMSGVLRHFIDFNGTWITNGAGITVINANVTCGNVLNRQGNYYIGASDDVIIARKAAAALQLGLDAAGVTNQMLTAASRITSDGVGANLTIAGGNGRGGAGGSLILSTYTTAGAATIGTLTTRWTVAAATGDFIPGLNATYSIGNNDSNCYKVFSSAFYSGILQVVGPQEAAVADASGGATVDNEARTAINSLLARMRSHGLIAN